MPIDLILLTIYAVDFACVCWRVTERFKAFTTLQWYQLERRFERCFHIYEDHSVYLSHMWEIEFTEVWNDFVAKDRTGISNRLARTVLKPTLNKMLRQELWNLHPQLPLNHPGRKRYQHENS